MIQKSENNLPDLMYRLPTNPISANVLKFMYWDGIITAQVKACI